ncbi:MAG: hypothetical protein LC802_08780 [Acidobacteria bacterium]|nr:hypothetical protein [Acidobacteriota bacterium]
MYLSRLLVWLVLLSSCALVAAGQVPKENNSGAGPLVAITPATYFGPFKINGDRPKDFEKFDYFILGYKEEDDARKDNRDALAPDVQGSVSVRGLLVTTRGAQLDFETVKLIEPVADTEAPADNSPANGAAAARPITLSFTTVESEGVSYAFRGQYLSDPVEECGAYTHLRGVLSMYRGGQLVAEEKVSLNRFAFEELLDLKAEEGAR